ncbi:S9 family peptidase [Halalkalirubrum salinum]|uniref:S9 family peptidase n=1 Tax=Halalkalirubrum salinum TaxID=2563889 RepID=UPI0010FB64EE|nr:S9 family peptidase [Halalkalirubrum salinum]
MDRISATDYYEITKPSEPAVSPDGETVAFVRSTPEDDESVEATIYLVAADGTSEPQRFTISAGVDSAPTWSPSGDRLAFVSTRGDDDDRTQLWVIPRDGGEATQVTSVPGGVSNPVWSPDGSQIAFVGKTTADERADGLDLDISEEDEYERDTPDPRVIDRLIYRQAAQYTDGTRGHVYIVNVETAIDTTDNHGVERLTDGEYDHGSPVWSDSETLYYTSKREDDPDDNVIVDIFAYALDTDDETHVHRTTGWAVDIAVTSDDRIAYPRTPEESASMRQTDLEVFDRATDTEFVLTDGLDRTVTPEGFEWTDDEAHVLFTTPDEGRTVLRSVAGDGSTDPKTVADRGMLTDFSAAKERVAYTTSEWNHPGDLFGISIDGSQDVRLTRLNESLLADRHIGEPEELRYTSADGAVELQGWLLTPPGFDPTETYPLAVEIHGGPHAMWSTSGTMWHEFQTLAARGYCVFWSNPRGSTGYGEAFATAIERDWGELTMEDVMAGVELVSDREYVDETNAFVTGGSFGGYMTGWIVGHTDFFDGAVAQRGVYDLSSFYGSTDAFKLIEYDFDTTPWEEPAFLWESSPVAHVENVETPTLVIHSDNDFRVPVNNGEMFYLFLKKLGVDTRLVRYPREGHELSRSGEPGHVVDRIERIARWFDGYSEYHDAPHALDRGDDGLSSTDETDE